MAALRTPLHSGGVRNSQHYLSMRMRKFDRSSSRWTDGKWRSLIPEFGPDVAIAFRDGAVMFWRTNMPKLLSNGAEVMGGQQIMMMNIVIFAACVFFLWYARRAAARGTLR